MGASALRWNEQKMLQCAPIQPYSLYRYFWDLIDTPGLKIDLGTHASLAALGRLLILSP
jgi:hypothetical protein